MFNEQRAVTLTEMSAQMNVYFMTKLADIQVRDCSTVKEMALLQKTLNKCLEDIKEVKTAFEKFHDLVRKDSLPTLMNEHGIEGVVFDGIGRVQLSSSFYVSVLKDNKEDMLQWLDDHGHGELINKQVSPASLTALAKIYFEREEVLPESIFKVTPYQKTIIKKS